MSRQKKFQQMNTDEWRARGFKSTKVDLNSTSVEGNSTSDVSTVPHRLQKVNTNSQQRVSASGKIQKRSAGKTPGKFSNRSKEPNANKTKIGYPKEGYNTEVTSESNNTKEKESGEDKIPSKAQKKKSNTATAVPVEGENIGEEKKEKEYKRKKQKFQGYTLFIGNLSYDTTKEDILSHFSKCGPIKAARLPLEKETNKPRGFAYLEVEDHVTYEKVLSLHHSFLKKRRINVECTFGGSNSSEKRKSLIKKKTLKLRFLSREGKISSAKKRAWGKYVKPGDKGDDEN